MWIIYAQNFGRYPKENILHINYEVDMVAAYSENQYTHWAKFRVPCVKPNHWPLIA
jgi:hypothetical protein